MAYPQSFRVGASTTKHTADNSGGSRYSGGVNLVEHKKARFDYEILEEYEAGIELFGHEVKALRTHQAKLEGSHVIVRGGEAYVVGMVISPYQPKNTPKEYDPNRTRKLLLTKKEILTLAAFEGQKGLTIVPISVYSKAGKLKMRIGVARGRKKYDKRAVLKERATKREIDRTLKNQ
jgi:SsrA-binding protein